MGLNFFQFAQYYLMVFSTKFLNFQNFYSFELFQLRVSNTLKVNSKIACENHSLHKLKILLTNDFWHPKESAVFRWRERLAKIPFFNFSSFLFITIYHDKKLLFVWKPNVIIVGQDFVKWDNRAVKLDNLGAFA